MRTLGLIPLLFSLVVPTMALAAPEGPVILKVTGNLDPADPTDGEVAFDMAMIQALPQHEIDEQSLGGQAAQIRGAQAGGRADGGEGQRQEHHAHRLE